MSDLRIMSVEDMGTALGLRAVEYERGTTEARRVWLDGRGNTVVTVVGTARGWATFFSAPWCGKRMKAHDTEYLAMRRMWDVLRPVKYTGG